jgi:CDP-diacylglycerol--glycerol-3-phosphate 3-phosphatidyltransferase
LAATTYYTADVTTDAIAAWATGGVWALLLVAYGVRVSRRGKFRSDRVAGVGGTVVMGEGIMQATYWGIEPVVRALVRLRLTPNAITTIALVFGLGAGVAIALGCFGIACACATVSTICDILDGQVARMTRTGSARGELYDAVVDRYTEFALIGGFVVFEREHWVGVAIALLALQASFMISYASAKAEALKVDVPRGLMRRHERATVLTLTAGLTPLLGPTLASWWPDAPEGGVFVVGLSLVAAIGTAATVTRFARIYRSLGLGSAP